MLKDKHILTIQNAIELNEDISSEAKGKGRAFTSRFIEPGIAHYEEFGDVLITKETLDKFIQTMVGCPVIIKHKDIDDSNIDEERVGVVSNVWFNESDGWYYCSGIIFDKQAIDLVKNQGWNVSCTYDFESDNQQKVHNGKKIDREFTGGEFLHLALVPNPRYERANIVMNAKEENNEGFVTLKRKDGSTYQIKLNPENKDFDSFSRYKASLTSYILKLDSTKDKELIEEAKKIQEEIQKEVEYEIEDENKIEKNAKGLTSLLEKISEGYNPNIQLSDDTGYNFIIDSNNSKGLNEKAARNLEKRLNDYKNEKIKLNAEAKHKIESTDWAVYVEVINKANNDLINKGDITMTVLNELKDFIKSVVNNEKGKEMDEKEVKNEDKRKLIDEVGGILKGKVDDEIIRTIMKKMEEASYKPSEDDKADNEADKEEKEEKFEEEKEIANKKAKNEEKEDKKESKNEDEEKDKDDEVDKEEVKNKCKNSMDDVKKIVMGGSKKVEKQYVSSADRFALGEKY